MCLASSALYYGDKAATRLASEREYQNKTRWEADSVLRCLSVYTRIFTEPLPR
jgi:hypothetical protein